MASDFSSSSADPNSNNSPEALTLQAEISYAQGNFAVAIAICERAILLQPSWAPAYVTLGNVRQAQGMLDAAIRSYTQAIDLDPNLAPAHANLGSMYYKQGLLEEAITCYRQALALKPDFAAVYWNLAIALRKQGNEQEAQICEQKAVEYQPELAGANFLFNQGNKFAAQGKLDQAQKSWETAIALDPNLAEAYCQIGMILRYRGEQKQAISRFEKALELKPNLVPAHQHLCGIFRDSSNLAAARQAVNRYRQLCSETDPIMTAIYSISTHQVSGLNQIAKDQFLQLESQLDTLLNRTTEIEIRSLYSNFLFSLPYLRDNLTENTGLIQKVSGRYIEQILQANRSFYFLEYSQPNPEKGLKIGIISSHFNRHAVGWCSLDVIRALSQITPEIYLYFTDRPKIDDRTALFQHISRKLYEPKRYPNGLPDAREITEEIRQDEIDILIDLDAISMPIHTEILYAQPAPVCLSWLGFDAPYLSEKNYFLCDRHTHPEGRENYYTEKLVRMPDSFVAVSGFQRIVVNRENLRRAYRISSHQIVYLCVAPGRKFNRELVEAQVAILKRVPNSILIHKAAGDQEVFKSAYQQACEAAGVSFHRVKFIARFPTEEEHRQVYALADVLLDSYPYNGGTHTLEALWFDVPVVTRKGEQFLSRMGYSFLQGVGVEAGVAESWEDYIDWAVKLGEDEGLRMSVKNKLIEAKTSGNLASLWNPTLFAQNLYNICAKLLSDR
ncbi:tetratricopeptide repeat protein [Capilliphycus salinus ALCB114379]|uniref:O-linked N-acetylglucosamine transferase, SPINDLY family protein n=1 Tax=Capilliphycus salinus TaxID=2768948 RepID=UPI0039A6D516